MTTLEPFMSDGKNLWGGRFSGETDQVFAEFNQSFSFDRRLFEVDVRGSVAHCDALVSANVLNEGEANQIKSALAELLEAGKATPDYFDQLPSEDVHSFVQARLVQMIGDVARKLHTGRSRNDQVATDLRLWLRDEIDRIHNSLRDAQNALLDLGDRHLDAVMPG